MVFGFVDDLRVTRVSPREIQSNVSLDSEILVYFSQAVDRDTLTAGTFIVASNSMRPIPGYVSYEATQAGEFIGRFRPQQPLDPQTTYQATIVGLANPFTGGTNAVVKNIVGNSMGKNFVWNFSTGDVSIQPPSAELPFEYSSIYDTRPLFRWAPVTAAESYQIEIGYSELMDPLLVPPAGQPAVIIPAIDSETQLPNTEWRPDEELPAGVQYFWHIRTLVAGQWSAWSLLHSFYVLEPGQEAPYVPQTTGPTWENVGQVLSGNEPFMIIGIDPPDFSMNVDPEYFRVTFNRNINPDTVDLSCVTLFGNKILQSDPNVREPGTIGIESVYVDEDEPNVLIIVPEGGTPPGPSPSPGTGSGGMDIQQYENLFRDILHVSGRRWAFGKHFMDVTERVEGEDELYTDTLHGELRFTRRAPYAPASTWKHTIFELELAGETASVEVRARFTMPDETNLRLYVSADDGMTYSEILFSYDPAKEIQTGIADVVQGNKMKVKVEMRVMDEALTPAMEWFIVLFNEALL